MLNMIFRTIVIFVALVIFLRLLGKRQLRELELSELVVSILVADISSVPLQNPDLPLSYGLLPSATLFICEFLLSLLAMKSVRFRKLCCGTPCFLIEQGKINQTAMRKCRFTVDELAEELRSSNVTDFSSVEYAVLETDGSLNVILYPEFRTLSPRDLQIAPEDCGYATVVIEEGVLLSENLKRCGYDEAWLKKELSRRGCGSIRQVYAMICFGDGKIYFAEKEGKR